MAQRTEIVLATRSGRCSSGGLGGRRARRRWRFAAGSCWRRRRAVEHRDRGASLGCKRPTVSKWRVRFAERGLDGLHDEPRPGKPRLISDEDVERVIVKTLEEQPRDATHWSTRSMAAATGMSQSAVSRIWRAFGLKPHQIGVVQALARSAVHRQGARHRRAVPESARGRGRFVRGREVADPGARPLGAGAAADARRARAADARLRPLRHHQPVRRARCRLRAGDLGDDAAAPRRGVPALPQPDRRSRCRQHLDVHVVLDNSSTHKTPSIQRWLVRHPRFTLHFTPTYSSWLNLVERWFAELTTKWIKRGSHRSVRDLVASIRTWITNWNDDPKPFIWHKTADEILDSLAAYCQRINDSGH